MPVPLTAADREQLVEAIARVLVADRVNGDQPKPAAPRAVVRVEESVNR